MAQFKAKVDNVRNGIMELNKKKVNHIDAKNQKKEQMVVLLQQLSKSDVARLHLFMGTDKKASKSQHKLNEKSREGRIEQRKIS